MFFLTVCPKEIKSYLWGSKTYYMNKIMIYGYFNHFEMNSNLKLPILKYLLTSGFEMFEGTFEI